MAVGVEAGEKITRRKAYSRCRKLLIMTTPEFLGSAAVGNRLAHRLCFAFGRVAQMRMILSHGFGGHREGRGLDKARPVLAVCQR